MKTQIALALLAGIALAPLPAAAQDASATGSSAQQSGTVAPGGVNAVDTETFVTKVPSSNQFEIESSKLALQKASDDQVKQFAQMMIDDHTKAGEKFMEVVKTAGFTPPGTALEERHQQMLETLSGQDQNFDQAYIQAQLQAHNEAVSLFSAYAESGDNEPLKSFATETLPTLKQHLAEVEQLAGSNAGATSSTTGAGATTNDSDSSNALKQPGGTDATGSGSTGGSSTPQ
jgi:putative membrane protein